MELSKVLRRARTTELKQLSDKDKTDEVLIGYVNMALEDMYSRFMLSTEEIIISLQDGKTLYKLDGTDPDVTVRGATIDPDDILMLVQAFDEKGEIPLNDDNDDTSIYTVSYDMVQVPVTANQTYISIIYKPVPVEVMYDEVEGVLVEQNVRLPRGLLAALMQFLAFKAGASRDENDSTNYETQYENECQKALDRGIVPQDHLSKKVAQKGFL